MRTAHIIICVLFSIINLRAQNNSDIIRYNKDIVIVAEASNLFPNINEPVSVKVVFKAPFTARRGTFALYYVWDDDVELVSGSQAYSGDLNEGQIVTMEVVLKFPHKKIYTISILLKTTNKSGIAEFTFYVDGAFRESKEVQDLRSFIGKQKADIAFIKSFLKDTGKENENESNRNLPGRSRKEFKDTVYPIAKYIDTTGINHNINPLNEYEKKNIVMLGQKNIELFNSLKQKSDSLWNEGSKLVIRKK